VRGVILRAERVREIVYSHTRQLGPGSFFSHETDWDAVAAELSELVRQAGSDRIAELVRRRIEEGESK
jgi:hypothetical protein